MSWNAMQGGACLPGRHAVLEHIVQGCSPAEGKLLYIELTNQERAALEAAIAQERRVRQWRRYQAIRLLADGQSPRTVASMLSVSLASIYNWVMAWRTGGPDGMRENRHVGRAHRLDTAAEQFLNAWLADKPRTYGYQVTSWTVPLLHRQLALSGYSVSERTLRRTLHRLGWRWRDGAYVLARPGAGSTPTRPGKIAVS